MAAHQQQHVSHGVPVHVTCSITASIYHQSNVDMRQPQQQQQRGDITSTAVTPPRRHGPLLSAERSIRSVQLVVQNYIFSDVRYALARHSGTARVHVTSTRRRMLTVT